MNKFFRLKKTLIGLGLLFIPTVTFAIEIDNVESLYIIGKMPFYKMNWNNLENAVAGEKVGDNEFLFRSVVFDTDFLDGDDFISPSGDLPDNWGQDGYATCDFQFYVNGADWSNPRVCPNEEANQWIELTDNGSFAVCEDGRSGYSNFYIPNGVYDITVNFNTNTISTKKVSYLNLLDFKMSFWQGAVNDALRGENTEASNVYFRPYSFDTAGKRWIYKIDVTSEPKPGRFASQMYLGGRLDSDDAYVYLLGSDGRYSRRYYSGLVGDDEFLLGEWKQKENSDEWELVDRTYFFDAHQTGVFVPVTTEFWCDNSRMEPGMTVSSIYLRFDPSVETKDGKSPFEIFLSADGEINEEAENQINLNNNSYALRFTSGPIYDALKGSTNSSAVTIPFAKHHLAKEGYVISFGKYIEMNDLTENFTFWVKDGSTSDFVRQDVKFEVTATDREFAGERGTTSSVTGGKFNKIILMVENSADNGGKGMYDTYKIWFSEDDTRPANYDVYLTDSEGNDNLPKLKVWTGNWATWQGFFNDNSPRIQPDYQDGTTYYYNFQPVIGAEGHRTNIYYLDLSNGGAGIRVRRGRYEHDENNNDNTAVIQAADQFNIIDANGYDISNPFQGSQLIYPDQWWCANPNLLDENGPREYNGKLFKEIKRFDSQVDLAMIVDPENGWEEGDTDITIYGITIFKIMGRGYDIYADDVIERPFYYIYASTDPSAGGYEDSCPILLEVDGTEIADASKFDIFSLKQPSNLNSDRNYYLLTKSQKALGTNDDINYTLTSQSNSDKLEGFIPGNAKLDFVDINGDQHWDASSDDRLIANTWTNYYSTRNEGQSSFAFNNPGAEFFRLVLATNPDQVRYQAMSEFAGLTASPTLLYKDIRDDDHATEDMYIYPVSKLVGTFVYKGEPLEVVLKNITDNNGEAVVKTVKVEAVTDAMKVLGMEDGFWEDNEYPINVDFGTFFVGPESAVQAAVVSDAASMADNKASAVLSVANLIEPEISNLALSFREADLDGSQQTYYSQFRWKNGFDEQHPGLPRTYNIYAGDVTGKPNFRTEDVLGNDLEALLSINHNVNDEADEPYYNYAHPDWVGVSFQAMTGNTRAIGYRLESVYNYVVPAGAPVEVPQSDSSDPSPVAKRKASAMADDNIFSDYDPATFTLLPVAGNTLYASTEFYLNHVSGVEDVDCDINPEVEFFNLQGVRIDKPAPGTVVLRRRGNKTDKIFVR